VVLKVPRLKNLQIVYFVTYRNISDYSCQRSALFVTIGVKWSNFFLYRKGRALCERPFVLSIEHNTAEWSFSKLRLIKTFHRSTMTDEKLTNLAMIYIESETAKTLDTTELTKHLHF